jgi:hypothetical protein
MAAAWPELSPYASLLSFTESQQTGRDGLKGTMRKKTMTTRRSFLGQAGSAGRVGRPVDRAAAARRAARAIVDYLSETKGAK